MGLYLFSSSSLQLYAICVIVLLSDFGNLLRPGPSAVNAGCVQLGRCCDGKNSTCKTTGKRMNNMRSKMCFCDSNCLKMGDCCLDYRRACRVQGVGEVHPPAAVTKAGRPISQTTIQPTTTARVVLDCITGSWSDWSDCDVRCGPGVKQRSRDILQAALNGGRPCGALVEKTVCEGTGCKLPRASDIQEALKETGKIVPAAFGGWRKSKKYDPYKDIRKNLFEHYEQDAMEQESRPSYCAQFELTETRPSCLRSPVVQWSKQLVKGASLCVECQALVMKDPQLGGGRCRGHGILNRETRWSAVAVPGCHGKWVMKTPHAECQCSPDELLSFVLV